MVTTTILPAINSITSFPQIFLYGFTMIPYFSVGLIILAFGIALMRNRNMAVALLFCNLVGFIIYGLTGSIYIVDILGLTGAVFIGIMAYQVMKRRK